MSDLHTKLDQVVQLVEKFPGASFDLAWHEGMWAASAHFMNGRMLGAGSAFAEQALDELGNKLADAMVKEARRS